MPKQDKRPIVLTGTIMNYYDLDEKDRTTELVTRDATSDDPEELVIESAGSREVVDRIPYERGDIALRPKLDAAGRFAVSGWHSNYGYSGYLEASVFDGKKWRAFSIKSLPETFRHYASQSEKSAVQERLEAFLKTRAGQEVLWGTRAYQLPLEVAPEISSTPE